MERVIKIGSLSTYVCIDIRKSQFCHCNTLQELADTANEIGFVNVNFREMITRGLDFGAKLSPGEISVLWHNGQTLRHRQSDGWFYVTGLSK